MALAGSWKSQLDLAELASAIIGLSHGLALERAASKAKLPMEVTGMAIRALLLGAAAKNVAIKD